MPSNLISSGTLPIPAGVVTGLPMLGDPGVAVRVPGVAVKALEVFHLDQPLPSLTVSHPCLE